MEWMSPHAKLGRNSWESFAGGKKVCVFLYLLRIKDIELDNIKKLLRG